MGIIIENIMRLFFTLPGLLVSIIAVYAKIVAIAIDKTVMQVLIKSLTNPSGFSYAIFGLNAITKAKITAKTINNRLIAILAISDRERDIFYQLFKF